MILAHFIGKMKWQLDARYRSRRIFRCLAVRQFLPVEQRRRQAQLGRVRRAAWGRLLMLFHVSLSAPPRPTPLRPYRRDCSHWCAAVRRRALLKLFRDVGNARQNPLRQDIRSKVRNTTSAAINGEGAGSRSCQRRKLERIASAMAPFIVSG